MSKKKKKHKKKNLIKDITKLLFSIGAAATGIAALIESLYKVLK